MLPIITDAIPTQSRSPGTQTFVALIPDNLSVVEAEIVRDEWPLTGDNVIEVRCLFSTDGVTYSGGSSSRALGGVVYSLPNSIIRPTVTTASEVPTEGTIVNSTLTFTLPDGVGRRARVEIENFVSLSFGLHINGD